MECPRCGTVYRFSDRVQDPGASWAVFDPLTARFTCTRKDCARTYVIGLVAWPVVSAPYVASQPPDDQTPDIRELAQLRREGGGWWMPDAYGQRWKRPLETNVTPEEDRLDEDEQP